ncbi:hypothetical protein AB0J43_22465 [Nonomuraea fuscirosea]
MSAVFRWHPQCKGSLCDDPAELMCLTRAYGSDASSPTHQTELCAFHAQYGDRRLTVVQVLHQIPNPAAAGITEG